MKRKRLSLFLLPKFFFIVIFISSCAATGSNSAYKGKNTGNPSVPTRHTSRVYPPKKESKRYLDSGNKKKKIWTKITLIPGTDCPWDNYYKSTSEKKIKKKLSKNKRKLGNS